MTHAIMLTAYQSKVGVDEYCVHFSGTLDECRAQTDRPTEFDTWLKSDFSACDFVENHSLSGDAGKIYRLTEAAAFAKRATATLPKTAPVVAMAGAGFLAGIVVGFALHKPITKRFQGGGK